MNRSITAYVTIVTSRKYSKERFIKEALRLGVSRAISLRLLRKIVKEKIPILLCEYKDGVIRAFGFFYPDSFAGKLKREIVERLEREGKLKKMGSFSEIRGCGIVSGETYGYTVPLEELLEELKDREGERKVLARGKLFLFERELELGISNFNPLCIETQLQEQV